jgi:hypothetical protein
MNGQNKVELKMVAKHIYRRWLEPKNSRGAKHGWLIPIILAT